MKQSKKRPCPVLGKSINSRECGENRGPGFGCPGDCPFNPWGDAAFPDPFREKEEKLKIWFAGKLGESGYRPWIGNDAGEDDEFAGIVHAIHVGDGSRPSPIARWMEEHAGELRKDDLVLGRFMDEARPMLCEVRQVTDDYGMECIDLLEPERPPFVLRDLEMPDRVCRFHVLFGWAYHTPWFTRMLGTVLPVPRTPVFSPADALARLARASGWKAGELDLREWLRRNYSHASNSLLAWQRSMTRNTLGERHVLPTCIDYKVTGDHEEIAAGVNGSLTTHRFPVDPELREDGYTLAMHLVDDSEKDTLGVISKALLLLGKGQARLEGLQSAEFDAAVAQFEAMAGKAVKRTHTSIHDTNLHLPEPPADNAGRPRLPEELDDPSIFPPARVFLNGKRPASRVSVISSPLPGFTTMKPSWLDGLTPQAAAGREDLRENLVNAVKFQIFSIDNQRATGITTTPVDFGPMLRDLRLESLDFPPTPLKHSLNDLLLSDADEDEGYDEEFDDEFDEDLDEDFDDEFYSITGLEDSGLPDAPARPVMDETMARRRYEQIIKETKNPRTLVDFVDEDWNDIFVPLVELLFAREIEERSPEINNFLIFFALMAKIYAPEKRHALPVDDQRLARAFFAYTAEFYARLAPLEKESLPMLMRELAALSPQPGIAMVILQECLAAWAVPYESKGGSLMDPDAFPFVTAALLVALWEMHYLVER